MILSLVCVHVDLHGRQICDVSVDDMWHVMMQDDENRIREFSKGMCFMPAG